MTDSLNPRFGSMRSKVARGLMLGSLAGVTLFGVAGCATANHDRAGSMHKGCSGQKSCSGEKKSREAGKSCSGQKSRAEEKSNAPAKSCSGMKTCSAAKSGGMQK